MPDNEKLPEKESRAGRGIVGFLRPALLFLLSRDSCHGYSLHKGLSEFGFDSSKVDPSLLYRTLREMEESGWIASRAGEESRGPRRKVYELLPEGKNNLAVLITMLRKRRDEINKLLKLYDQEQV